MCGYWIGLTRGITLQHLNLCSQLRHHSKLNFMTLCCTYVIQHRFVHKLQRRVRVRKHCSLTLVSYAKAQNPCLGQPHESPTKGRYVRHQQPFLSMICTYEGCMIISRNSIFLYMQPRWFLSILKDHPSA